MNEQAPAAAQPMMMSALAIKLPPFWKTDPLVWFAQAEAQFSTRGISSEATKYSHVIAALPQEVAQEVRDILICPPENNQYQTLKEKLMARVSASEQRRVQMLLTEEELGDRKPSQLLRRMEQLLGDQTLEKGIFKQLFLQRLPVNVRLILASTSEALSLSDLSELADRIIEAQPESHGAISAVAQKPGEAKPRNDLENQVSELTRLVRELTTVVGNMQRRQSRSRSRRRDTSARRDAQSTGAAAGELCWYHSKYGDNAHRCRPPCAHHTEN
nr:uncharacterized protein LOC129278684 [Lytechinus pictus]